MKSKQVPSFKAFSSLAHVTYHGDQKFVVISYSNDPVDPLREHLPHLEESPEPKSDFVSVTFEVGEIGGLYRWWRGLWTLDDVKKIAGPGGKEEAHRTVISSAAKQFIEGNISIANLRTIEGHSRSQSQTQTRTLDTTQTDSQANAMSGGPTLRIDSTTDTLPFRIPLYPLPSTHAAERGTQILFAIISEISQNRSARIFPLSRTEETQPEGDINRSGRLSASPRRGEGVEEGRLRSRKHEAELEKQVLYLLNELKKHDQEVIAPPPVVQPGRSLGNPTRKARKVQTVEFDDKESEEEKVAKSTKRKKRA